MKFWKKLGEGFSNFLMNGGSGMANRYGFYFGEYFVPFSQETIESLDQNQLIGRSVLGHIAAEDAPEVQEEPTGPEYERMHAAELRPRVMKAWMAARQAERLDLTAERAAVAQGIVDLFPALSEHLGSPRAHEHISLSTLLEQAEIQDATLRAITDTYIIANQEP